MSKAPKDPQEIFPDIVKDYIELFADDLLSVILYGSAASGDYIPGRSDINFMIVLSDAGIDRIDQAFDLIARWQKRNVATPLFLTEAYVNTSLDVFPIEYLSFQNNHRLVYGKDILEDISFDSEFVRLQCEREIKGKMLLLREGFLESRGKGRNLQPLIANSLGALIAIFNGLLHLKGKELPHHHRDIIKEFCEAFDMDGTVFSKLLDVKEKKVKLSDKDTTGLFKDYLKEVQKLWQMVDTLNTEEGSG
ncbi:MAG: nucleotidyltransferase domain-containing protein [Deltaproteobacteria bacterium]|nr:nucleotidyltransferase domain-containing protein [Deltaproteobacteria bacterium]